MLSIINDHNYPLNKIEKLFSQIFKLTVSKILRLSKSNISAAVFLSNCDEIRKLNCSYRKKNEITDVLSFKCKADFVSNYLGDIVICYPVAEKQALEYQHSLKRELCFLFLHGLLHLLGYDHTCKDEEDLMFSLQDLILQELNIKREVIA